MTDTNRPEAVHDVLRDMRQWKGDYSVFADRIERALSARASAGEGGDTRCDQYVLDSFNGARKCMNKRAPGDTLCKKHRATAEQTGYTAAPQPATGGRDWRNEAFNLADTVIERIECGDKQGARDAIGEEFERLAAAPQTQPTINSSEIDSKLTDARPSTPPAHGDGEGVDAALDAYRKAWERAAGRLFGGLDGLAYLAHQRGIQAALTTRPTPEAQEARDAALSKGVPGYGGVPIDFDDPELQQW